MMENLKLYNENHEYIKTDTREFAHSKECKLYHDCVHIILINHENEVLLQKRSAKKFQHPNLWDLSVTGHVSSNDDLLTACVRETAEEIGIDLNVDDFENAGEIRDDIGKEFINFYVCKKRFSKNTKFEFKDCEVNEVKFFNYQQFEKILNSNLYSPYFDKYKLIVKNIVKKIIY